MCRRLGVHAQLGGKIRDSSCMVLCVSTYRQITQVVMTKSCTSFPGIIVVSAVHGIAPPHSLTPTLLNVQDHTDVPSFFRINLRCGRFC